MYALTTHSRAPLAAGGAFASACAALVVAFVIVLAGPLELVLVAAIAPATWAAAVDLRSGRLPNRLIAAGMLPIMALLVHRAINDQPGLGGVLAGATLFAAPLFLVHVVAPDAMGFGDVKLAALLGAALGLVDPRTAVGALCLACAGTASIGLVSGRRAMPLGPGLVVGTGAALVYLGGSMPWR